MLLLSALTTKQNKRGRFVATFFVCVCLLSVSCCQSKETVPYENAKQGWRDGDLVLRCGYGIESRAVIQQSQSLYSHVGILCYDNLKGEWLVVHAVPGEDEPEYVKKESAASFFSPSRACRGGWLRVDCTDNIARAAALYALDKANSRVLFDNEYSLADTVRLYCTELVWRAYAAQGIDISGGCRQSAPVFFCSEGEGIFPSNLEKSETTLFVKHLN